MTSCIDSYLYVNSVLRLQKWNTYTKCNNKIRGNYSIYLVQWQSCEIRYEAVNNWGMRVGMYSPSVLSENKRPVIGKQLCVMKAL